MSRFADFWPKKRPWQSQGLKGPPEGGRGLLDQAPTGA
jgi:hypothetical protein